MFFLYFTQFCDMLPVLRRCIPFGQLLTVIFPVCPEIISTCAVAIQWLVCMQAIAMQTGHWISNPLPNEQNAAANADARARKREFCECGSGLDARMSIQPHRWKLFLLCGNGPRPGAPHRQARGTQRPRTALQRPAGSARAVRPADPCRAYTHTSCQARQQRLDSAAPRRQPSATSAASERTAPAERHPPGIPPWPPP